MILISLNQHSNTDLKGLILSLVSSITGVDQPAGAAGARRCEAHGAPEKPASADAAASPMRANFTLIHDIGCSKI
jgi:hypothetical protein